MEIPNPKELNAKHESEVAKAGVPDETAMRDSKAPRPETPEQLAEYIRTLTDRPHTYGTCCYAMSLAAVAAFNHVANKLGVTGFQASCADMDILRQTRGWEWGRILNFDNLLYPQYCDEEHFPGSATLLAKHADKLREKAKEKLASVTDAHPDVVAHWKKLASA